MYRVDARSSPTSFARDLIAEQAEHLHHIDLL
jgi:transposase InsO family protein